MSLTVNDDLFLEHGGQSETLKLRGPSENEARVENMQGVGGGMREGARRVENSCSRTAKKPPPLFNTLLLLDLFSDKDFPSYYKSVDQES